IALVLHHARILERQDFIRRRGASHQPFAMQRPFFIEKAAGQREFEFGLEHDVSSGFLAYANSRPSWASSSISIATSAFSASRSGASYFVGQARMKFQRA